MKSLSLFEVSKYSKGKVDESAKKIIIDSLSGFLPMSENVSMSIEGWKNINFPGSFNIKHNHQTSTKYNRQR